MLNISVRKMTISDIELICNYWLNSDNDFLFSMGVDLNKLPTRETLSQMLLDQINKPLEEKNSFCLIWELDGKAIGHSNTNPTFYGEEATMHLHLWDQESRKIGMGSEFLKKSIACFFSKLRLKRIICEPYSLNSAPNKVLEKAGFRFIKEYITVPGSLNFEQPVKRWELEREQFQSKR